MRGTTARPVLATAVAVCALSAGAVSVEPAYGSTDPLTAGTEAASSPAVTDPTSAGFTSDEARGGRVRAVLVVPHVMCPPEGEYGVSFRLSAFSDEDHLAGSARLTFVCFDGVRETELGLNGGGSIYPDAPDIHYGPADPLRFTIVDLGTSTEVRVRNLENGDHDSFAYEREELVIAEAGADRTFINDGYKPIPPYDGFDGFSDVRLGRARPSAWTRVDMVDGTGSVELRPVKDGRRDFDLVPGAAL